MRMTQHRCLRRAALLVVLAASLAGAARAQQPSAPAQSESNASVAPTPPRPEQLEPAVQTSRVAAPVPHSTEVEPAAQPALSGNAVPAGKPARRGVDRLQLEASDIKGNRELPKVMYVVPWKRSDLGDLVGRPVNSLLDEVLQPLDRDVFRRENRYYDALQRPSAGAKSDAAQGSGAKP